MFIIAVWPAVMKATEKKPDPQEKTVQTDILKEEDD